MGSIWQGSKVIKKEIKTYDNRIHVIEDFISKESCDFLIESFRHVFTETPSPSYKAGPSYSQLRDGNLTPQNIIFGYNRGVNNMAVDLYNSIAMSMLNTLSEFYSIPLSYKTLAFGSLLPGGKNTLHMDNRYLDSNLDIKKKPFDSNDRSGLLYLNDNYTGGQLHFPKQNLKISPKPGTFIFFEGNEDIPHEVTEVISGERFNIISFLWHIENLGNPVDRSLPEGEWQMTEENLGINR